MARSSVHRDAFRDTIWAFEVALGERHWFAFVFAVQRPYLLCFLPLRLETPAFEPEVVSSTSFEALARRAARLVFAVGFQGFTFDRRFDLEYRSIFVAQHLQFVGRDIAVCNSEAIPLDDYMNSFPQPAATEQKQAAPKKDRPSEATSGLLTKHPWLAAHATPDDTIRTEDAGSPRRPVMDEVGGQEEQPEEEQQEEDLMQGVFAELTAKRAEVLGQEQDRLAFPVRLLGGAWTARNKGVPYDAFSAAASSAEVSRFCTLYRVPKSSRFDISAYGESGASVMCHAWSKRMSHFFALAQSAGPGYKFHQEDLVLDLGAEFEAFALGLEGRARSRAQQIRDVAPTNP